MCFNSFKVAFLFIGAIIGAGFASGSEIIAFFGDSGVLAPIFSGLLIGVLAMLFAKVGNILSKKTKLNSIYNLLIWFSTCITYIAMVSGAESIIRQCFQIKYIGLISGLVVAFLSIYNMNFIKNMNFIIVPVIIILMLIIAFNIDFLPFNPIINKKNTITYATMNILLGGFLMAKEGETLNNKNILVIGTIIAIVVSVMLFVMYNIAMQAPFASMPVFEVSLRLNYAVIAGIIIYLSILSTLIGAGKIINDFTVETFKLKFSGIAFLLVLSVFSFNLNFNFLVNTFYPLIGYIGVLGCVYIISFFLIKIFHRVAKRNTFHQQVRTK